MTFADLHLHAALLQAVRTMGYAAPTPVQRDAIPLVLSGTDLMVQAATGTGKTAAFALPMLHRLQAGPRGRVKGLVLSPTRELAEQTREHLTRLGRHTRLRSLSLYGGVNICGQAARLRAGVEILAACPGRLLDHLRQGSVRLDELEMLVIDEADSLFQMGFIEDVRAIIRHIPDSCQRLLFSATLPPAVQALAGDALRSPRTLTVDRQAPAVTVTHALYPVPGPLKPRLLAHILSQHPGECMVVFARTRHGAARLAQNMEALGFRSACLQGQLSQRQRNAALNAFRRRELHVLVATDVASRGIDVSGVSHVINYDIPETAETYIHRTGRTGRAQTEGTAITFVTPGEEGQIRHIERSLGQTLPRHVLDDFNYTCAETRPRANPRRPVQPAPARAAQNRPAQAARPLPQRPTPAHSTQPKPVQNRTAPGRTPYPVSGTTVQPAPARTAQQHPTRTAQPALEKTGRATPQRRALNPNSPLRTPHQPHPARTQHSEAAPKTTPHTGVKPQHREQRPFWEQDSRFPEKTDSGIRYYTRKELNAARAPKPQNQRTQKTRPAQERSRQAHPKANIENFHKKTFPNHAPAPEQHKLRRRRQTRKQDTLNLQNREDHTA